uniref:Peptidase S1 domain-containing protein n=1 Tax=Ciona savignyi TaxID=51511 RepID=H2Z9V4_CIOSA
MVQTTTTTTTTTRPPVVATTENVLQGAVTADLLGNVNNIAGTVTPPRFTTPTQSPNSIFSHLGISVGGLGGLGGLTGNTGFGGLGGLGSLGGLSGGINNIVLKGNCESRGCCWDSSNSIFAATATSCYQKAFPKISDVSLDCYNTLTTCGTSDVGILARVVGGTPAVSNRNRPWQVIIRAQGTNVVRCSGTIICSQWIITAASCLGRIRDATLPLGSAV